MMRGMSHQNRLIDLLAALVVLASGALAQAAPQKNITLAVDAREAPRHILHVREVLPVTPGPLTLEYPKWIPGEHAPDGPIADLVGIEITAGKKKLSWSRDPVDMYALKVEVPAGANQLEVAFDYLSPVDHDGFSSGASLTAELGGFEWNLTVLYPAGAPARALRYAASLTLPRGWKWGSALEASAAAGDTIHFQPVTLETLIDSPVIAGAHFRKVALGPEHPVKKEPPHEIDIAADSEAALAAKPETIAMWKHLVEQSGALFGARHYQRYHFLLALSDHIAHFGLEHHQSSDNRAPERMLVDDDINHLYQTLLPHEFTHSWNGKYRRPAGLVTLDYSEPMKGNLLWIYEGLTNYIGTVLAGRSGATTDWMHDELAETASSLDIRPGRSWRPLEDTAVAAQILYGAPREWGSWRRSVDYYPEGTLLWLEVDTIIREKTKGARSLDDFCRRFHGGPSTVAKVVPYELPEVEKTLGEVAPYDWHGFFASRVDAITAHPPLAGLSAGGWKVVYDDQPNASLEAYEKTRKVISLLPSIGALVKDDGSVLDVVPGRPAAKAGLAPGMKLIAVDGRRFSPTVLKDALRATPHTPLELIADSGEFFKTFELAYRGGLRQPHLRRIDGKPDLLDQILAPLPITAPVAAAR